MHELPLYQIGPALEEGKKPTLLFFALGGEESLHLDPINQPARELAEAGFRIFSCDLPHHGPGKDHTHAMEAWRSDIERGHDFFTPFMIKLEHTLESALEKGWIDPDHFYLAGVSRGAFVALHLATRMQAVQAVLGFAPLIYFPGMRTSLFDVVPLLLEKKIRLYMGNRDTRVGTKNAFTFLEQLVEAAGQRRSLPYELILYPSVGYKGHGTPPSIFEDGVKWLLSLGEKS